MNIRGCKKLLVGSLAALLVCSAFLGGDANAVQGESITMSPAAKPYKIKAGERLNDSLTIINDGTVPYVFKVYTAPYSVKNSSYDPDFETIKANTDAHTWLAFPKKEWKLKPGEKVDVSYTVSVPADAAPGGHYGVIFAETQPEKNEQIARKKRVGAIVYATVEGEFSESGRQVSSTISPLQIAWPLSATMVVENTGNTDFMMREAMIVKNVFGSEVYKKIGDRRVLPKTTRDIALQWEGGAWLGVYNVKTESEILGQKTTNSSWVFIAPLWFFGVVIALVGALLFFGVRRLRR